MKKIGILAVQGAFAEHKNMMEQLNIETIEVRKKTDFTQVQLDGLILPGGESTVMGKLLYELDMMHLLRDSIQHGLPVLGTCAGLILLAKKTTNDTNIYLGTMDIEAKRNAYGRQLGSFQTLGQVKGVGNIPMTFIRAPYIEQVGPSVEILSKIGEHIVAAQQDNMLVTSFHPELTEDLKMHQYFLNLC